MSRRGAKQIGRKEVRADFRAWWKARGGEPIDDSAVDEMTGTVAEFIEVLDRWQQAETARLRRRSDTRDKLRKIQRRFVSKGAEGAARA